MLCPIRVAGDVRCEIEPRCPLIEPFLWSFEGGSGVTILAGVMIGVCDRNGIWLKRQQTRTVTARGTVTSADGVHKCH